MCKPRDMEFGDLFLHMGLETNKTLMTDTVFCLFYRRELGHTITVRIGGCEMCISIIWSKTNLLIYSPYL